MSSLLAYAGLFTVANSAWELSRKVRRKHEEQISAEIIALARSLRSAHAEGWISTRDYDHWYRRLLDAQADGSRKPLRRCRVHLAIVSDEHRDRRAGAKTG